MSIAIEDVPMWLVSHGVGHALMRVTPGSPLKYVTVCGMYGNFIKAKEQAETPRAICSGCREVLGSDKLRLFQQ